MRAGSMPPITSTTTSTSSRATSAAASVVNSDGSTGRSRTRGRGRRTAMPTSSSGAPIRAARSSAWSLQQPGRPRLPTTPQPEQRRPAAAVFDGSSLRPDASRSSSVSRRTSTWLVAGAHRDDRRARHVVVVAGHRPAVRAGRGDGEQVARARGRRAARRPGRRCRRSRSACRPRGPASARQRSPGRPARRCSRRRRARSGCCRSSRRRRRRRSRMSVDVLDVPTS